MRRTEEVYLNWTDRFWRPTIYRLIKRDLAAELRTVKRRCLILCVGLMAFSSVIVS